MCMCVRHSAQVQINTRNEKLQVTVNTPSLSITNLDLYVPISITEHMMTILSSIKLCALLTDNIALLHHC